MDVVKRIAENSPIFYGGFMKSISKKLAGIGLALCMATSAMAAGLYDGIYQSASSPSTYASVHQNGATLIVLFMPVRPASTLI
jgi:hypothetical protein